jgi:hypothetical protein
LLLEKKYYFIEIRPQYGIVPFGIIIIEVKTQENNSMCIDIRKTCECHTHTVQFHMRDNIMAPQVISRLFCPLCNGNNAFDNESMLCDNGWVIEYDMDMARGMLLKKLQIDPGDVIPEFIFDKGYACWQEMYPGEQKDIKADRERIIELLQQDRNVYLHAMQNWNIERIERLKSAGWRKVQQA